MNNKIDRTSLFFAPFNKKNVTVKQKNFQTILFSNITRLLKKIKSFFDHSVMLRLETQKRLLGGYAGI